MVLDPVSNTYGVGRLHGNTDRNRQGSGGECSISGLFVVRGERDVIPLNQSGFDVVVYRDIQIRVSLMIELTISTNEIVITKPKFSCGVSVPA